MIKEKDIGTWVLQKDRSTGSIKEDLGLPVRTGMEETPRETKDMTKETLLLGGNQQTVTYL